jgi:hypothetical protein
MPGPLLPVTPSDAPLNPRFLNPRVFSGAPSCDVASNTCRAPPPDACPADASAGASAGASGAFGHLMLFERPEIWNTRDNAVGMGRGGAGGWHSLRGRRGGEVAGNNRGGERATARESVGARTTTATCLLHYADDTRHHPPPLPLSNIDRPSTGCQPRATKRTFLFFEPHGVKAPTSRGRAARASV